MSSPNKVPASLGIHPVELAKIAAMFLVGDNEHLFTKTNDHGRKNVAEAAVKIAVALVTASVDAIEE